METIRKIQFMVRGYCDFTKRSKPLPPLEGLLEGRTFVITGGNSGIGLAAAMEAAKRKASVFLLCRDKGRGEEAVQIIKKETGNQLVKLVLCELGDLESMKQAADEMSKLMERVDILVHNGGCMLHERKNTKEGVESNFATNTLAVYYLTRLCLGLLHPLSRTIVVSSGGCLTQPLITDDIYMEKDQFDGTAQYARNKRQQLCIMEEFTKIYPGKGKFFSMHPGWSDTPALRVAMPDFHAKMKDKLKTPEEGADTIVYLSVAPFEKLVSGQFYFDREVADKHLLISCTKYKQPEADTLMRRLKELSMLD